MYIYKYLVTGLGMVVIQQCIAGFPMREEYLIDEKATQFLSAYEQAKDQEKDKDYAYLGEMPTQKLMETYF